MIVPRPAMLRDRAWLDELRTHRCIVTGRHGSESDPVEAAHLGAYKGMKRPDNEALPLLHSLHAEGHRAGEWTMWRARMPDWLIREALRAYARQLYAEWKQKEQAA